MPHAPWWSEDEFARLMRGYGVSDAHLAAQMPRRPIGGIAMVRQLVHSYHRGRNLEGLLGKTMLAYLERHRGGLQCPYCGEAF